MQDLLAGMLKNQSYKHATAEVTVTAAMGGSPGARFPGKYFEIENRGKETY